DRIMLVLCLVLPSTFFVGVFVWSVFQHFLTTDVPSTLQHPSSFRFLHCPCLCAFTLGSIFERLGICSMPRFIQLLQGFVRTKKDARLATADLYFGTIPVRLFQPKAESSSPRQGIIFFHGGGGLMGSLDLYHDLCSFLALETDSVLLSVGLPECLHSFPEVPGSLWGGPLPGCDLWRQHWGGGAYVACVSQALVGRPDLPRIWAQVLIYPVVQQKRPFLSQKFMMICVFKYLVINVHWWDAILEGAFVPPDFWRKYKHFLSSDNIPKRFRKTYHQPVFPAPFNEAAYLENKHLLDVENNLLIRDDETITQLPEAFLVSCEHDILHDDALLYRKRLKDQGVPVMWYHVEDGFHGSLLFFGKKYFSFPCSLEIVNAVTNYIKSI
uniref:Arylacetamide deacetylase like 4 n=1 Tax=Suricata suricatta TaxID=37032 RepID=A0A673TYQ4_SURSU